MKFKLSVVVAAIALSLSACTRVETGEVGLRIGFDKQVNMTELPAGSMNQVIIGDVITFPVRDVRIDLDNKTPVTADNTPVSDFDISLIYSINPTTVAELYTTKSRAFHVQNKDGDTYLMYDYLQTVLNNATYKVVRTREALKVVDDRALMENEIRGIVEGQLKSENLENSLKISQVLIRNVQPNVNILKSATEVITAQNALKAKTVEVETAKKEAERIAALNSNAKAIEYMSAQAQVNISEAVLQGKVSAIVVPYDFKGIINLGK